jgi:2-polyprenyl-3-methyl-5-hydroxy-6-metoxy-1,4-benzoquinol methylase
MFKAKSDEAWEYYGKNDPYFGVLTAENFRKGQLTAEAKKQFFETGERYAEDTWTAIQGFFGTGFHPTRAMDFGCGVGRLVLPFARRCDAVVGVDVSESMLETARANAREQGLTNATFVQGDDTLSRVTGRFDFVHSFIVFQHIPPSRGFELLRRQIALLTDDGIGALHFTYAFASTMTPAKRRQIAAQRIPLIHTLSNLVRGKSAEPAMEMNEYDVNELLKILQESGCHDVHLRFSETSHRGHPFYGVTLFFRKRRHDVQAHG